MAVGHAERDIRQALAVWRRSRGLGGHLFSVLYTPVTAGGGGVMAEGGHLGEGVDLEELYRRLAEGEKRPLEKGLLERQEVALHGTRGARCRAGGAGPAWMLLRQLYQKDWKDPCGGDGVAGEGTRLIGVCAESFFLFRGQSKKVTHEK